MSDQHTPGTSGSDARMSRAEYQESIQEDWPEDVKAVWREKVFPAVNSLLETCEALGVPLAMALEADLGPDNADIYRDMAAIEKAGTRPFRAFCAALIEDQAAYLAMIAAERLELQADEPVCNNPNCPNHGEAVRARLRQELEAAEASVPTEENPDAGPEFGAEAVSNKHAAEREIFEREVEPLLKALDDKIAALGWSFAGSIQTPTRNTVAAVTLNPEATGMMKMLASICKAGNGQAILLSPAGVVGTDDSP